MRLSWKSCLSCAVVGLVLGAVVLSPARAGFLFDLADAVGGGNGTLPGTGGAGNLAATAGIYTTYPAYAFVDGAFVPNNAPGAIQIDGDGHTFDFDAQTSAGYYNPWINGNNLDTDPSGGPLPNFNSDPNNHSLMTAHANKGITFDLQAIRTATGTVPNLFTTIAGDSRPKAGGTISYWVFVDGALAANRNNVTNSEDALFISLSSTARYLTLVVSDSNDGIGSDHGYFGDAFLRSATVWNGAGADGNWANGANWVGGAAPVSGTSTEVWINGDTNVGTVTPLNQNIANPFVLNRLEVTGTGMTNAVNTGGQPLSFQAAGTLLPTIHVSRNTAVTFSGNLNLAADTAITVDDGPAASDLTVSGQVTGAGTLTKYGQGTVVFSGTNGGFSGNVVVNAGTLVLDRQNSPPLGTNSSRTVTVNAGATLTATADGHNPFGTVTAPSLIIINGGTMNTSNYQHTTNLQMTGGTIQPTSAGTQADGLDMRGDPSVVTTLASASQATIASKMTVRNAVTFNVADGAAAIDLLMSGQIVGPGGMTKTGAGLMRLSNGGNSFTGGVNVQAGTLQLGADYALPFGAGKGNVQVDGTLDLAGFKPMINGLNGAGTVDNSTGTAFLTVGMANTSSSFSGTIKNTAGTLGLIKTGAGTLTLGGTNTYSGTTNIGAGTLKVGSNGAIPSGAGKGNVLLDGTLDVAGYSPAANGLSGVGTVDNSAGNGSLTLGAGDASSIFYGTIKNSAGSLSLVKAGTGTTTLAGNNTYSGATTVTAGTLKMSAPSAAPAGGTTFWLDAANAASITESGGLVSKWADRTGNGLSAEASGAAQPSIVAGALNGLPVIDFGAWGSGKWMQWMLGGSATQLTDIRSVFWVFGSQGGGGHLLGHTGTADFHRGPYVFGTGNYNPGLDYSAIWGASWTSANIRGGSTYLEGGLVDGTAVGLNGAYQLIENITTGNVSANNLANDRNIGGRQGGQRLAEVIIYNRPLTEAERLATEAYLMQKWYGAPATGGVLPSGTALQIQGGATLDLNGTSQTVASLADYGGSGGTVANTGSANSTLTVNGAASTAFSGTLQDGPTNTLALVKQGPGTLALSGASTYSGGTTVHAGTLLVNNLAGSATGTGAVSVAAGILAGNGAMAGPVTVGNNLGVADSILSPGNSIGALHTGPLTLNSDAVFDLEINTGIPAADLVVVSGGLTLNSPTLLLTDLGPNALVPLGTTLTIIDYAGPWDGGTFQGLPDDSAFWFGPNRFVINYNGGPNGNDVLLTTVPEPASVVLLLLGGMAWAVWRLRRTRSRRVNA